MVTEWNALKLSEAMVMVEEFVNQADESLDQVKIVVTEARKIANIPAYLDEHLIRLGAQIERIDGLKNTIKSVWDYVPGEVADTERKRARTGCEPFL